MSFFKKRGPDTATVARDRLKIILAHENSTGRKPDYLVALQGEIMNVIAKYVQINPDDVKVHVETSNNLDILEVKIELPEEKKD